MHRRAAFGRPSCYVSGSAGMRSGMSTKHEHEELTQEELEEHEGEPLPDREVMSRVDFNPGPPALDPDPGHTLPIEPPATE
jgi:hypothetical protein